MRVKWMSAICFAFVLIVVLAHTPRTANAFECPKHFAAAQAAIDNVLEGMKGMEGMDMKGMEGMDMKDMASLHSLVDDAKMILAGAIHNHEKPQGAFDHAQAIAKADTALGYAEAANIYHFRAPLKILLFRASSI